MGSWILINEEFSVDVLHIVFIRFFKLWKFQIFFCELTVLSLLSPWFDHFYAMKLSINDIIGLKHFLPVNKPFFGCHSQCKKWAIRKLIHGKNARKENQERKKLLLTGSGVPRGGPHSIIATSPSATRVFCGSNRKSSRSTKHTKDKRSDKEDGTDEK